MAQNKKQDKEFDLQPLDEEFDLQPNIANDSSTMQKEDKPWPYDLWDTLKGGAKQIANEGITQIGDLKDIAFPDDSSYMPERFPIASEGPEAWGAKTAQFGQYLAPIGLENKAGNLMQNALRKGAIGLARRMAPSGARAGMRRAIAGGGNVIGRSAIGAGVGAGTSAIVDEGQGVKEGAIMGGAFPGMAALGKETGVTPLVSEFLKEKAGGSLARAIQPGTTADRWALKNVLEPVLEKGRPFFSMKGLKNMALREVKEAGERQKAVAPGADTMVDFDEALNLLRDQKEQAFMTGRVGEGGDVVPSFQGKEAQAQAKEFDEWINDFLLPQSVVNQNTGQRFIPFDRLDEAKRYIQNEAGKYHAYTGVPEQSLTNRIEAYKQASHPIRKQLEDVAGDQWAKENEIMSTWLDVMNLARKGEGKTIGKATPLSERAFTGFGAHLQPAEPIDPSIVIRVLRHITNSPGWNSLAAQSKFKLAKFFEESSGVSLGQLSNAMYPKAEGSTATIEALPDLINNFTAPQGNTSPVAGELEWDPQTQTFKPTK